MKRSHYFNPGSSVSKKLLQRQSNTVHCEPTGYAAIFEQRPVNVAFTLLDLPGRDLQCCLKCRRNRCLSLLVPRLAAAAPVALGALPQRGCRIVSGFCSAAQPSVSAVLDMIPSKRTKPLGPVANGTVAHCFEICHHQLSKMYSITVKYQKSHALTTL